MFARTPGQCDRVPGLVVLSCVLILLFPIVSATDDLQAMQPVMEESSSAGRFRPATNDKSASNSDTPGTCLNLASFSSLTLPVETWFLVTLSPVPVPNPVELAKEYGRAPPILLLS